MHRPQTSGPHPPSLEAQACGRDVGGPGGRCSRPRTDRGPPGAVSEELVMGPGVDAANGGRGILPRHEPSPKRLRSGLEAPTTLTTQPGTSERRRGSLVNEHPPTHAACSGVAAAGGRWITKPSHLDRAPVANRSPPMPQATEPLRSTPASGEIPWQHGTHPAPAPAPAPAGGSRRRMSTVLQPTRFGLARSILRDGWLHADRLGRCSPSHSAREGAGGIPYRCSTQSEAQRCPGSSGAPQRAPSRARRGRERARATPQVRVTQRRPCGLD
jgi:hypothetical protein